MSTERPRAKPFIAERAQDKPPPGEPLAGERAAAKRALDETREALQSGEIVQAAENAVRNLETAIAGKPEAGDPGEVVARVVAVGDRRSGVPAVPLEGLRARLKVDGKVIAEGITGKLGLVSFPLGDLRDVSYEVEVLGTDCAPTAPGRSTRGSGGDSILIEVPRTEALKPHLERARPLEDGIRDARDRAALGAKVITDALVAQEKQLVEYLAELGASASPPTRDGAFDAGSKDVSPAKDDETVSGGATPKPDTPGREKPSPEPVRPTVPPKGRGAKPSGRRRDKDTK
jgi:hypothetical protein